MINSRLADEDYLRQTVNIKNSDGAYTSFDRKRSRGYTQLRSRNFLLLVSIPAFESESDQTHTQ